MASGMPDASVVPARQRCARYAGGGSDRRDGLGFELLWAQDEEGGALRWVSALIVTGDDPLNNDI